MGTADGGASAAALAQPFVDVGHHAQDLAGAVDDIEILGGPVRAGVDAGPAVRAGGAIDARDNRLALEFRLGEEAEDFRGRGRGLGHRVRDILGRLAGAGEPAPKR